MEPMTHVVAAVSLLLTITLAAPLSAQSSRALPSFAYVEASGCEGLFLYTWNEARSEVLTIRVDRNRVKITEGTIALNLATAGAAVAVQVELTADRRETMPYCSESGQPSADRSSIWSARAGILKIVFRRRASPLFTPVSVTLDDLVLTSEEGAQARAKRTIHFTAAVADLAP